MIEKKSKDFVKLILHWKHDRKRMQMSIINHLLFLYYFSIILLLIIRNNHNARITNFEKEHYKQDRVNLEDNWMTMNCMNCSNADLKMIASNVDSSQENRDAKLKCLHNNEENITNIIDLLIKISTLEKKKSKDHSWKEITLKLIQHLWLDSEEKHHANQNTFIAKNV